MASRLFTGHVCMHIVAERARPLCGSHDAVQVSRFTGWNAEKGQELKDPHRAGMAA